MSPTREQGCVRTLAAAGATTARLVCFPHSGGSATAYRDWAAALPSGVELLAVQYPGRGDRFGEQLVDDVAELARHVVQELLRLPCGDQVLFGHSLGAMVAYETAVLLRDMGREPAKLCVSACLPPGQLANREVHLAPETEFWQILCDLGGIDPRVAQNRELRELMTPVLRSDLRAHATYQPSLATKPLSCPVTCYHGVGDPLIDQTRLSTWADVTSDELTMRVRPGGHFHVTNDIAQLVSDVLARGA